ncbi:MAG: TolC family protein [Bryobacterales bacterium]|jgi:outer membrane protein TolC|nr:TolC family protein [Bryobacterales bacterium]
MWYRLLFAFLVSLAAYAQPTLSLPEAVDRALARHPQLSVAALEVDSQQGLKLQAGKTYNPSLNFQLEDVRAWQSPGFRATQDGEYFAFLQQQWELFGKRQRRTQQADAAVRIAMLEQDLARRQIALRVKAAYWQALGAQQRRALLNENLENFARIVEYHEARVREGAMAEADLLRIRLERERLLLDFQQASLDAQRARILLQLAMGEDDFDAVSLTETLGESPADPAFDTNPVLALAQRVELAIRRVAVEQAGSTILLERANARTDLTWLAGYKRAGPFDSLVLGAQFDLMLRNRNEGNIASAQAEQRQSQALLRAAQQMVRAEAEAALESYRIRRQQLQRTLPQLRRQAQETAEIAEAAYREGGSDLLRLLDAQRVRIEARQVFVEAMVAYHVSLVELEAALGVPQ